jgi:hypothetical protein
VVGPDQASPFQVATWLAPVGIATHIEALAQDTDTAPAPGPGASPGIDWGPLQRDPS